MAPERGLAPQRLERLVEVGRSLVAERELDAVLDRVLDAAQELTGARYAALGVLDPEGRGLERFLARGVDWDAPEADGDPHGRGVLGVLVDDPRPLRLHDVTRHPRAHGFPPGHPVMRTFLGVPVLVGGEHWGNLYLTEKAGGRHFDAADERSLVVLADWAAIAIDNARLYRAQEARREELERAVEGFRAAAAVAQAVGAETDLSRVLDLIVDRARTLVGARGLLIWLVDGTELRLAAHAGAARPPQGARLTLDGSTAGDVLREGRACRFDAADLAVDPAAVGIPGAHAALIVPLVHRGRRLGVLSAFDRAGGPAFAPEDEQTLAAFAASAATAVAIAKSVGEQRLRQSIEAAEAERGRWARELHDQTLQGLAAVRLGLSAARNAGEARRDEAIAAAIEQLTAEVAGLRAIIADLRPAALDELGLEAALRTLAGRTATTAGIGVDVAGGFGAAGARLPADVETAIYRVVQEALTNVVKHAGATRVEIALESDEHRVTVRVRDDGRGFDASAPSAGFGLLGMRERVELAGGSLAVEAGNPRGTVVRVSVPLAG